METHFDTSLSPTERANALLLKLDLREKIGQLSRSLGFKGYVRSGTDLSLSEDFRRDFAALPVGIFYGVLRADWWSGRNWDNGLTPRLMAEGVNLFQKLAVESSPWRIPAIFVEETPHGMACLGATVFPTGIGLGATWNPKLIKQAAAVIGDECAAAGIQGVYGPVVDIARDPRWSRVEEDFSEDPFLASALGVAYVEGLQGAPFPLPGRPFATLKHFAAHGDPEGGHNHGDAHLGMIELRNVQARPFQACVKAGARSVMSAYNTIDGIPCHAHRVLMTDMLRDEWGFEGVVVADGGGVRLLMNRRFGMDAAEVSAKALKAGLDTGSCGDRDFHAQGLREALERGLITMEDLDQAVRRMLVLKFRLGLFENPYLKTGVAAEVLGSRESRDIALNAARQSLTLLSNPKDLLPFEGVRSIAVIGPNADTPMNQLGDYSAPQRREDVVTVLDGMRALGAERDVEIHYARGCKVRSLRRDDFEAALDAARQADAVVLVLGGSSSPNGDVEFHDNGAARIREVKEDAEFEKDSGEGYDRARLRLGGLQLELLQSLRALGKPLTTVLVMGRPMLVNEVLDQSDAVLLAWYPGMMGGQAIAEALFGDINPGGKLPISFPRHEGQLPVYYNTHWQRSDYIDMEGSPRLSFGFGLSYTRFAYSGLRLDKEQMRPDETATVTVEVENAGERAGDEVVQLYLTDRAASVVRPWRELCGFQRVHLQPGERQTVEFTLGPAELGLYNEALDFVVEPGAFTVAVGGSLDIALKTELTVMEV